MTPHLTSAPAVSFDLSDWSQIELSGAGIRPFLHNFCTNDINGLSAGELCETFLCDVKGRILGHVFVLACGDHLRLIGVPGTADVIVPHLTKYLLDAPVTIVDRSRELGLLCLHGAGLGEILRTATGIDVQVALNQIQEVPGAAGSLWISGADLLSESTLLVSGKRLTVAALREQIPAQFLELGARDLFELLRIEAGFPHYGRDLGNQDIAQAAARTARTISFTKGCYLGQEPIARLDAMGHTTRELRGLIIPDAEVHPDDPVFAGDKEVGRITTTAYSSARSATIGLAMLRVQHAEPGTRLTVRTANGAFDGTVFWPTIASLGTAR